MKRKVFWVMAFVLALSVVPQVCFADPSDELADKILQDKDAAAIKEQLAALAKVLDLPEEKEEAKKPEAKPEQKTMADVGERALEMAEGMIASTAATLEKYAPEVWRIMIRQQYAKAMSELVVPLGIVILSLLVMFVLCKAWTKEWFGIEPVKDPPNSKAPKQEPKKIRRTISSDGEVGRVILGKACPIVGAIAGSIWLAFALKNVVMLFINPEYYAIRDLVLLLLGKGQL